VLLAFELENTEEVSFVLKAEVVLFNGRAELVIVGRAEVKIPVGAGVG